MLTFANFQQRVSVKLDRGEIIVKCDVVWLTFLTLKLLTGQCGAMLAGELINGVTNYYTKMLHSHFVNTSMYRGYQLNHPNLKSNAQNQWLFELHDRHWATIPDIFYVGRAMPLYFFSCP
jgi:pyrimidine operon attenuation protein/uracil phosphoribosyltransferase